MSAPTVVPVPAPRTPAPPVATSLPAARLSRADIADLVGEFGIDAYSLASRTTTGGAR